MNTVPEHMQAHQSRRFGKPQMSKQCPQSLAKIQPLCFQAIFSSIAIFMRETARTWADVSGEFWASDVGQYFTFLRLARIQGCFSKYKAHKHVRSVVLLENRMQSCNLHTTAWLNLMVSSILFTCIIAPT